MAEIGKWAGNAFWNWAIGREMVSREPISMGSRVRARGCLLEFVNSGQRVEYVGGLDVVFEVLTYFERGLRVPLSLLGVVVLGEMQSANGDVDRTRRFHALEGSLAVNRVGDSEARILDFVVQWPAVAPRIGCGHASQVVEGRIAPDVFHSSLVAGDSHVRRYDFRACRHAAFLRVEVMERLCPKGFY
jgi:hypothetical protein